MPLIGDIETIPIASILQLLSNENKTGILSVKGLGIEFQIYFDDGFIIHAIEPLRESRLSYILINEGALTAEKYDEALKLAMKKKQALGNVLLEEGYLEDKELKKFIYMQIQEIIFSMLCFTEGQFEFKNCQLNKKWFVAVKLNTLELVIDALRRLDDN